MIEIDREDWDKSYSASGLKIRQLLRKLWAFKFYLYVKMVERNTKDKYIVIECNVEMVETNNRNAHKTKQIT